MGPEYQHQLDDLFLKIAQLEAVVRSQQQTIVTQQQAIEVQQERIKQLESALAAAESALAAAKKNSSNSSKPPSSDIVKPKKPGADNKNNGNNQDGNASSQKKRGGQKGHEGHFRPEFPADQIDEVVEHTLTHCPSCGTKLEDADRAPCVVQQVKTALLRWWHEPSRSKLKSIAACRTGARPANVFITHQCRKKWNTADCSMQN